MTKAKTPRKKYGEPYPRRILLKKGDIREIANITGYAYESVVYQLSGTRRIQPSVRAVADRFADRTQAELDAIKNMEVKPENN